MTRTSVKVYFRWSLVKSDCLLSMDQLSRLSDIGGASVCYRADFRVTRAVVLRILRLPACLGKLRLQSPGVAKAGLLIGLFEPTSPEGRASTDVQATNFGFLV